MTKSLTNNQGQGVSEHSHTNALINETSPYLLQHAHNPVDWYPWGEEALAKTRAEDKPILLSIGYAACHWCHVMEHESFEDEAIAALMNERFVNIKVDREERPDLDQINKLAAPLFPGHVLPAAGEVRHARLPPGAHRARRRLRLAARRGRGASAGDHAGD